MGIDGLPGARPRTALVLSAGGMFGAYQAGVWKALSPVFQPDLVVGASIGAVNGWAIAAGCPGDRLIDSWLHLDDLARYRWRVPIRPSQGFLDTARLDNLVKRFHHEFRPRVDYGAVLTDTFRLRPVLFRHPDITWRHLAASTAILGFFSQHKIDGRSYSDGGLLGALPLWAAVQMGAERIVAVNVLPRLPNFAIRNLARGLRSVSRFRPRLPESVEVFQITAPAALGSAKDALLWRRENVKRWVERGERDAEKALSSGRFTWRPATDGR